MVQDSDTPVEAELAALQPPRTKDTDKLALTAGRDFASGTRLLHSVLENEMNYPSLDNFDVSIGKVPAVDAPGAAPEPVVPVDLASGTQAAQRLDLISVPRDGLALNRSAGPSQFPRYGPEALGRRQGQPGRLGQVLRIHSASAQGRGSRILSAEI